MEGLVTDRKENGWLSFPNSNGRSRHDRRDGAPERCVKSS